MPGQYIGDINEISDAEFNNARIPLATLISGEWEGRVMTNAALIERIQDVIAALLTQGTNVTLTYNDTAATLTIDSATYTASYNAETNLFTLTDSAGGTQNIQLTSGTLVSALDNLPSTDPPDLALLFLTADVTTFTAGKTVEDSDGTTLTSAQAGDLFKYDEDNTKWVRAYSETAVSPNTTYTLSLSDSTLTLTPSEGSAQTVTLPAGFITGANFPSTDPAGNTVFLFNTDQSTFTTGKTVENEDGDDVISASAGDLFKYDETNTKWVLQKKEPIYTLTSSATTITLTDQDGTAQVINLPNDQDTTYTLTKSGDQLTLTPSSGTAQSVTVTDTNTNTTYSMTITGKVVTLTGSDGTTQTITIPDPNQTDILSETDYGSWTFTTASTLNAGEMRLFTHTDLTRVDFHISNTDAEGNDKSTTLAGTSVNDTILFSDGARSTVTAVTAGTDETVITLRLPFLAGGSISFQDGSDYTIHKQQVLQHDYNTTYTFAIDASTITVTDSDGNTQSIALPSNVSGGTTVLTETNLPATDPADDGTILILTADVTTFTTGKAVEDSDGNTLTSANAGDHFEWDATNTKWIQLAQTVTDSDTTYTLSLSGHVLTLQPSEGSSQTVTLPWNVTGSAAVIVANNFPSENPPDATILIFSEPQTSFTAGKTVEDSSGNTLTSSVEFDVFEYDGTNTKWVRKARGVQSWAQAGSDATVPFIYENFMTLTYAVPVDDLADGAFNFNAGDVLIISRNDADGNSAEATLDRMKPGDILYAPDFDWSIQFTDDATLDDYGVETTDYNVTSNHYNFIEGDLDTFNAGDEVSFTLVPANSVLPQDFIEDLPSDIEDLSSDIEDLSSDLDDLSSDVEDLSSSDWEVLYGSKFTQYNTVDTNTSLDAGKSFNDYREIMIILGKDDFHSSSIYPKSYFSAVGDQIRVDTDSFWSRIERVSNNQFKIPSIKSSWGLRSILGKT